MIKSFFLPFNFTFPLVLNTRLDDVERSMPSLPFNNTHDRTTLSMAFHHGPLAAHTVGHLAWQCHHLPWNTHMVGRHQARCVIIALEKNTVSDDIGRGLLSSPYVRIHDRMTSRVTSSLESWAIFKVERCRAWHNIIVLGHHQRSDDVRRDFPSSPLVSTHGQTTSGMAWNHIPWKTYTGSYNARHGMSSSPVESIHG